jgi:hypothetical protein
VRLVLIAADRQTWVDFPVLPDRQLRPGHHRGDEVGRVAFADVVELALPFTSVDLAPGTKVALCVHALRNDVEVERLPRYGFLTFTVPDRDFERINWRV